MTDWSRHAKCWECGAERACPCVDDDGNECAPCEGRPVLAVVVSIDPDIRRIARWQESRPSAVVVLARLVRGETFSVDRAVAVLLVRHGYATMIGESVTASRKGRDALAKWDARPPGTR